MDYSNIKTGLEGFVERYDSQTYIGSYRETGRSSLLNDGLSTRANSLWKMAEYVVAKYDGKDNPLINYISGWKQLASGAANQYLLIEENSNSWGMYDSQGKRLGGEEYINEFFLRKKKEKSSTGHRNNTTGISLHLPHQQIFYGAPGTGKSNKVKEQTAEAEKEGRVFRTTFHPDSDYSTFVGCYKPTMKLNVISKNGVETKEEQIVYRFVPQAFTNAYVMAWSTTEDVYLVIEEINRGNCAQIFGDLFQLLDRKDGVSEYPINADSDLRDHIYKALETSERTDFPDGVKEGKKLVLPSNLYIWATMNTSDQSLFPIDSAFKRRWDWVYMPINTKKENWHIKVGGDLYSWTAFLEKVNNEILTDETAEDKHLGFYFCKAEGGEITQETFVGKVLFYLWNDVFKVYGIPSAIGSSKEWAYTKFYNTDGTVNEQKVKDLMEKLAIEKEPAS